MRNIKRKCGTYIAIRYLTICYNVLLKSAFYSILTLECYKKEILSLPSRSQLYQHSLQRHVLNCINIVFNITFSTVST